MTESTAPPTPFPRAFWTANTVELFERAAYYSMASFMVIYLGRLGMGSYWPSFLSSSVLWSIVYFLPILSGTIADIIGFRKALLGAFVLLCAGYVFMGWPVWFGGEVMTEVPGQEMTAGIGVIWPVVTGILLIGIGGSVIKPCISGTVQKTHMGRATLAFAVFYMVINVGSIVGRVVAFQVRTSWSNLSYIFLVAAICAGLAFLVVLFVFKDPDQIETQLPRVRRSVGRILLDMVLVLKNPRFTVFLVILSGFWFLYNQVYNILPLYVGKIVEVNPAMDLYTVANPITIVLFQLVITRFFGKIRPVRSIVIGTIIISLAMTVNIIPLMLGDVRAMVGFLPIGSVFIILTVSLVAFGELFTSPRTFEYIGALAPKGQEGLYLGYANLPTAIGALVSGWIGAYLFNEVLCGGAVKRADGLLDVDSSAAMITWSALAGIGLLTALSIWVFNVWLEKKKA